ncbi:hypothetical protein Droror1_Dr00007889 [Drosera rotundifolia]
MGNPEVPESNLEDLFQDKKRVRNPFVPIGNYSYRSSYCFISCYFIAYFTKYNCCHEFICTLLSICVRMYTCFPPVECLLMLKGVSLLGYLTFVSCTAEGWKRRAVMRMVSVLLFFWCRLP